MTAIFPLIILLNHLPIEPLPNSDIAIARSNGQETYFELLRLAVSGNRRDKLTPEQARRLGFIGAEQRRIKDEANQLIQAKKYNLAVAKYKEMLQYEPAYVSVYFEMGDVRYIEGNINAAIDLYRQGQEHAYDAPGGMGRSLEPWTRLGDIAAANGNYAEAVDMFRQVAYQEKDLDWTLPDGRSIKD